MNELVIERANKITYGDICIEFATQIKGFRLNHTNELMNNAFTQLSQGVLSAMAATINNILVRNQLMGANDVIEVREYSGQATNNTFEGLEWAIHNESCLSKRFDWCKDEIKVGRHYVFYPEMIPLPICMEMLELSEDSIKKQDRIIQLNLVLISLITKGLYKLLIDNAKYNFFLDEEEVARYIARNHLSVLWTNFGADKFQEKFDFYSNKGIIKQNFPKKWTNNTLPHVRHRENLFMYSNYINDSSSIRIGNYLFDTLKKVGVLNDMSAEQANYYYYNGNLVYKAQSLSRIFNQHNRDNLCIKNLIPSRGFWANNRDILHIEWTNDYIGLYEYLLDKDEIGKNYSTPYSDPSVAFVARLNEERYRNATEDIVINVGDLKSEKWDQQVALWSKREVKELKTSIVGETLIVETEEKREERLNLEDYTEGFDWIFN